MRTTLNIPRAMLAYARHWKIDERTLAQETLAQMARDFGALLKMGWNPHTGKIQKRPARAAGSSKKRGGRQ